jgi:hypothetical protein
VGKTPAVGGPEGPVDQTDIRRADSKINGTVKQTGMLLVTNEYPFSGGHNAVSGMDTAFCSKAIRRTYTIDALLALNDFLYSQSTKEIPAFLTYETSPVIALVAPKESPKEKDVSYRDTPQGNRSWV